MKVYERVLKACLRRKITVRYGRCSSRYGVSKCSLTGVLLAHDNLCIVMAVTDEKGDLVRLVVINKSEIESISIEDKVALNRIDEALSEVDDGDGRD